MKLLLVSKCYKNAIQVNNGDSMIQVLFLSLLQAPFLCYRNGKLQMLHFTKASREELTDCNMDIRYQDQSIRNLPPAQ